MQDPSGGRDLTERMVWWCGGCGVVAVWWLWMWLCVSVMFVMTLVIVGIKPALIIQRPLVTRNQLIFMNVY